MNGALAGAVAAGLWAAQQPLDKRVFDCDADDLELLGKLVTRGDAWPIAGLALHVSNGALFGAGYATARPFIPGPAPLRGVVAALAEHFASWPLARFSDRYHPARGDLVALAGDRRALAQATWRHFLFGAVLGELERRLNAPADPDVPPYEHVASSNGHGSLEHAGATGPIGS
jgi:hypothetical protein